MNYPQGQIWLEEYDQNPSLVALCFVSNSGEEIRVGLAKPGVEATIDLLEEWLVYNEERMEELFADLMEMGSDDD